MKEKKPQMFIPPELFKLLEEVNAVTQNEIDLHSQEYLLEAKQTDVIVRKLDTYSKKIAVLFSRKTILADEAAESSDPSNARQLGIEVEFLGSLLTFFVVRIPFPQTKRRMGSWAIRKGFVVVLEPPSSDGNGGELEVEFEPEDPFDDGEDEPTRYTAPVGKKKLH